MSRRKIPKNPNNRHAQEIDPWQLEVKGLRSPRAYVPEVGDIVQVKGVVQVRASKPPHPHDHQLGPLGSINRYLTDVYDGRLFYLAQEPFGIHGGERVLLYLGADGADGGFQLLVEMDEYRRMGAAAYLDKVGEGVGET